MPLSRSSRAVALSLLLVADACVAGDSTGVTLACQAALNAEDGNSDEAGISLLQLRAHRSREALVQALRAATSAGVEAEAESSEHALLRAEATDAVLSVAQSHAQAGAEADLGAEMTEEEAQAICAQIPGCKGFTMQYQPTSDSPVVIDMKDKEVLLQVQSVEGSDAANKSSHSASASGGSTSAGAVKDKSAADSGEAGLAQPTGGTSAPTESLSVKKLLTTLTGDEQADNTHAPGQNDELFDDEALEHPHVTNSDFERAKPDSPSDLLEDTRSESLPLVTAADPPSKSAILDAGFRGSDGQAWSLADVAQLLLREAKAQEVGATHIDNSADAGSGGRSLGEVAQEILRLATVSSRSDEHSIRSEDDAPHSEPHFDTEEPALEPVSDAPSAEPSIESTWEEVDGGEGRACRGLSKVDHSEMYFTANRAGNLATCKEACEDSHSCVGLSYDSKELRCEVWRRPAYIGMSVAATHGYCLRYHGAASNLLSATSEATAAAETQLAAATETDPVSAALDEAVLSAPPSTAAGTSSDDPAQRKGVSASFEAVDGGSGRSCRGASQTDHADQYYFVETATTLGECQEMCKGRLECVGVEFRSLSGRCEVWTRPAGIGASEEAANSECHRRLHVADTAVAPVKEEVQPEAEQTTGSDIFQKIEKLGAKLEDRRDGTSDLMLELRTAAKELREVEAERKAQEETRAKLSAEKREKRRLAKKEAEKAKAEAERRAHTILPGDSAEKVSSVIIGEVAKLGTKILDFQSNGASSSNGPRAGIFSEHVDYAFAGNDLGTQELMTLEQAKKKCEALSSCRGFNFQGSPASSGPVNVRFKSAWNAAGHGWSSFHLEVDHTAESEVRKALANIEAAELKASADAQNVAEHAPEVSEPVSESQTSAAVLSGKTYEFEAVDGGTDRACRGQKSSDSFGWYYDLNSAATLDECKALCLTAPICKGIEFNSEVGICEVWTRKEGIGMTEAAEGYQCHRLREVQATAPKVSEASLLASVDKSSNSTAEVQKAWSDIKRLSLGFEAVDGGRDRACRGFAENDIKESHFEVRNAATLDECKARCLQAAVCTGVDFVSKDGQCKLWKRAAGIGASARESGHECHRFLGAGASYSKLEGYAFAGGEMLVENMTVGEAEAKCASLQGCKGFTYEDAAAVAGSLVEIRFKSEWAAPCRGWTSLRLEPPTVTAGAIEQQTSKEPPAQLAKLGSEVFDQFAKLSTAMAKGSDSSAATAPAKRSPLGSSGEGRVTLQAVQEMIKKALGDGGLEHHDEVHNQKLSAEAVQEMISKALGSSSAQSAATKTAGQLKKQSGADHDGDEEDDESDDVAEADKATLLASSWRHEESQRKREQKKERHWVKLQAQEEKRRRSKEAEEEQDRRQAMQAEQERQSALEERQEHKNEVAQRHAKDVRKEEQRIEAEKPRLDVAAPNENTQDDDLVLKNAMMAAEEAREALSKFQVDEVPTGEALKAELKDIKKAVAAAKQAAALVSKSQAASKSLAAGDDETSARAQKITKIARLGTSLFKKIAVLGSRITAEESTPLATA